MIPAAIPPGRWATGYLSFLSLVGDGFPSWSGAVPSPRTIPLRESIYLPSVAVFALIGMGARRLFLETTDGAEVRGAERTVDRVGLWSGSFEVGSGSRWIGVSRHGYLPLAIWTLG